MRRTLLLLTLFGVACDSAYPYGNGRENEIVFGISQDAEGVSADYELIGLGGHGGSTAAAFRDGDGEGECWFEDLDDRLGKSHFDSGVARWTGGTLGSPPGTGLLVQANQPEPTKQAAPGWTSDDTISFYAEGFAMPPLDRVTMRAPLVELALGAVAPAPDASGSIALTPATDVGVTWTPPSEDTLSRVLVSLETEHANVRCFNRADAGSTIVSAKRIAQLLESSTVGETDGETGGATASGATVRGKLVIATHRQTTLIAPGNWLVYVVATSVQRDIAFTGTRE